ncbi:MAG: type II/IV secretion system ATPase subunit [Candidatus Heimdallarchaeaceae archaeon]
MENDFTDSMSMDSAVPLLEETYPVSPPFSYVLIQTNPVTQRTQYMVVEIPLDSKEKAIYNKILEILIEELDVDFSVLKDFTKAEEYLKKKIVDVIKRYRIKLNESQFEKIMYYLTRDLIGFGKIQPLMLDPNIEDISCDGVGIPIYVWHRKYESIATNVSYDTEEELDSFIIKLAQRAGRHVSIANPLLDASLEDGSRVQLTYGREVTQRGSTFTIRKFKADPFTITDLILYNTIDIDIAAFYWFVMEHNISILVAGGTAAGKTTLLNTLCMMIKPDMKIVTIEDTAELNLAHENWIPSVVRSGFGETTETGYRRGQISMYELLRAAMRQRPDYIIVGEIRGKEAYAMFQAMSTGHRGLGTIHGDSVEGVIHRLESKPMDIPRNMMKSLDIIHVIRKVRHQAKFARRTQTITEIIGLDPVTEEILTNKVYQWNPREDTFIYFGRSYVLEQIMENTAMTEQDIHDELERRKTVLRWMVKKRIRYFEDVASIIQEYNSDPDRTFEKAKKGLK